MRTGNRKSLVAEKRGYRVTTVEEAKAIAQLYLEEIELKELITFGLPEVDDRYNVWRVPLKVEFKKEKIGEVVIDAKSSLVLENKTTQKDILESRILGRMEFNRKRRSENEARAYRISRLRNIVALGNSEEILDDFPADSVDLVFTSPPYYNARPEYTDYITYEEYLLNIRKVIQKCHRVLHEGRFFVMNTSPVLVRRASRSESSKRIAVPFDIHRLFIEEGFEFVDDIIWQKPDGAGWATGRGRRFAADRNPLQYKPVPVTEYVLVYRKESERLIDWFIRNHPNKGLVKESKIGDDYERTNIWRVHPATSKYHPAVFPVELAKRVIEYYSFKEDVVLDPYAGIGTVGKAAVMLGRRFILIDNKAEYVRVIRNSLKHWLGKEAAQVMCINCEPVEPEDILL
jgi:DNA modification methylase